MRGIEPNNKHNVVFPSSVLPSRRFGNPPFPEGEGLIGCVHDCHLRALVEKSAAIETRTSAHDPQKDSPAVARRREIPCGKNDDTRTRITDQANTLNALSLWARRGGTKCRKNSPQVTVFSQSGEVAMLRAGQALATWQSPGRENLLAYTDKTLLPWGISPLCSG